MKYYRIYGLKVKSQIKLDELIEIKDDECNCKIDVEIKIEKIPDEIIEKIARIKDKNRFCEYSESECWFYICGVAAYRIYDGKYISIQPVSNCIDQKIKTFLLGGAFICLLLQRKFIGIHGSAVAVGDSSIVITGESGAGKSTLLSEFVKKGYKFLADDLCAVEFSDNGEININSAYPQRKLCRDAAEWFNYSLDNLKWIDEERDKFAVDSMETFIYGTKKLKAIFEINVIKNEMNHVMIKEIKGIEKFKSVVDNLYESNIVKCLGIKGKIFENITKLSQEVPYYKIYRPYGIFTLEKQFQLIKSIII